jgi:hypothetical protein
MKVARGEVKVAEVTTPEMVPRTSLTFLLVLSYPLVVLS